MGALNVNMRVLILMKGDVVLRVRDKRLQTMKIDTHHRKKECVQLLSWEREGNQLSPWNVKKEHAREERTCPVRPMQDF